MVNSMRRYFEGECFALFSSFTTTQQLVGKLYMQTTGDCSNLLATFFAAHSLLLISPNCSKQPFTNQSRIAFDILACGGYHGVTYWSVKRESETKAKLRKRDTKQAGKRTITLTHEHVIYITCNVLIAEFVKASGWAFQRLKPRR